MDYVLITSQPRGDSLPDVNVYGPSQDGAALTEAGHLLADGSSPPMTFRVLPLQPARWDSL